MGKLLAVLVRCTADFWLPNNSTLAVNDTEHLIRDDVEVIRVEGKIQVIGILASFK